MEHKKSIFFKEQFPKSDLENTVNAMIAAGWWHAQITFNNCLCPIATGYLCVTWTKMDKKRNKRVW